MLDFTKRSGYGLAVDARLDDEQRKARLEAYARLEQAFEEGLIRGFW